MTFSGKTIPGSFSDPLPLLDRAVHPLNLAIGPRVVGFGQPVIHVAFRAYAPEDVLEGAGIDAAICELHSARHGARTDGAFNGSLDTVWVRYGTAAKARLRSSRA